MTAPNVPAKIQVAFQVMAYSQSVQSTTFDQSPVGMARSSGRQLSDHEKGMLAAAQNLVRNWLNDEIELESPSIGFQSHGLPGVPFQLAASVQKNEDDDDDVDDEEACVDPEDLPEEEFPF